ncbi:MAG: glycoside hydrolase [Clostridia bacterium]|nr:glycoside hydrolase [Clostridia bacterium]
MSVYRITLGTPEELVPTKFSPKSKIEVTPLSIEHAKELHFKQTARGLLVEFPLNPGNEVYGFGLQLKGFRQTNRKKTIRPNADPISNTGDSHAPVPFFVTTEGWGIFVDSARYVEFNCGYTKVSTASTAAHSELKSEFSEIYAKREASYPTVFTIDVPHVKGVDLYIFKGENMLDCICQYNLFSGGGCDVSLWGLGNLYRCHLEFNEKQVLEMAEKFRKMEIPCDILGLEPGWQSCSYSSSFVWDSERFPHYKETFEKLKNMGFKVNLWEQGFVHPSSPLYEKLLPYSGDYKVWDGLVPDFSTDGARELFVKHHEELQSLGVKGYKLDECDGSDYTGHWTFPLCSEFPSGMDGEQYHSLFGTLFLQTMMQVHGREKTLAEVRNLGALASSYPFVLYSDLYNHKDFIRGVSNAGFSGLLWSPEVRHAESKEDLVRRVQTVVFSVQSLINAFYLDDMPWIDKDCTEEIKALLELRMALVPYLYTAFYEYKTAGKPPVRALVCEHPEDKNTHELWDEYYFGDSIIVAPMTAKEESRKVYLPEGQWYGFFDGKKYEGGAAFEVTTADIPVFVKSGTVLPLATPVQYIEKDTQFEITLYCYGNTEGAVAKLIEDNGFEYAEDARVLRVNDHTLTVESYRYGIKEIKRIP